MALGKSIRIYLKDGNVTGIKYGEIVNQTILSISCPRSRLHELSTDQHAKRPGIYFLFGFDELTNDPKAYIGEAENVFDRLQNHIANKEFWNEVILFVSKDENLTKSHVKYLESKGIQNANKAKRYSIDNSVQSQLPLLPPSDRDSMEEFFTYIKLLLGVMGHKLLEELGGFLSIPKTLEINFPVVETNIEPANLDNVDSNELYLNKGGITARAYITDEGIVVKAASQAAKNAAQGLSPGYKALRTKLISDGTLKLVGDKYIFQSDQLFSTASPAAAVIVGYSINGRDNWKDSSGRSLNVIETQALN